nr:MAG TPA: hypothetical protein [Caudoviricetes sp.]
MHSSPVFYTLLQLFPHHFLTDLRSYLIQPLSATGSFLY